MNDRKISDLTTRDLPVRVQFTRATAAPAVRRYDHASLPGPDGRTAAQSQGSARLASGTLKLPVLAP